MKEALERLARLFVVPASTPGPAVAVARTPALGLLCPPRDAPVLAAATALGLARRLGHPAAVALVWTGADSRASRLAPVPAARRVAARLQRREIGCDASGRLVTVRLPADAGAAADVARRALAAAHVPCALALAGPRCDVTDGLMTQVDATVVVFGVGADPLAALVADSLPVHGVACEIASPGPLARALATHGLAVPPGLRAALLPAMGAVT